MSIEIFVNVHRAKRARRCVENGALQEVYIERVSRRGLVGNLYKGRVSRVLPGMQAAFIEIGLERTAFLHAADIASRAPEETVGNLPQVEDISRLVTEGDDILVQVIKDPMGTKGARLTTFISLPSKYLVYMPHGSGVGVSSRIEEEGERERLKTLVTALLARAQDGAYILRTAAQAATEEHLSEDMRTWRRLWQHVQRAVRSCRPGRSSMRTCRWPCGSCATSMRAGVDRVLVDSSAEHAEMLRVRRDFHARRGAPHRDVLRPAPALRPARHRGGDRACAQRR